MVKSSPVQLAKRSPSRRTILNGSPVCGVDAETAAGFDGDGFCGVDGTEAAMS